MDKNLSHPQGAAPSFSVAPAWLSNLSLSERLLLGEDSGWGCTEPISVPKGRVWAVWRQAAACGWDRRPVRPRTHPYTRFTHAGFPPQRTSTTVLSKESHLGGPGRGPAVPLPCPSPQLQEAECTPVLHQDWTHFWC